MDDLYNKTSSAIELLTSSRELSDITNPISREKLARTLSTLDATLLSEEEIRNCFAGIRVAMAAFITKVNVLEDSLVQIKKDQVASEARLEAMCLQARNEIKELRLELTELRINKKQPRHTLQLAKILHGSLYSCNNFSFSESPQVGKLNLEKLPSNFTTRLSFAEQNGFKWNQNNRVPNKPTKQIEILEEWESQFSEVEKLPIEQILDRKYIVKIGPGAVAAALMILERELGALLPERKTLSIFNCYQRAVKLYSDRNGSFRAAQTPCRFDAKSLIRATFCNLPERDIEELVKRLETKVLATPEQVLSGIKKMVSKSNLPAFLTYAEEDNSDTQRLYSIQSGKYDSQLLEFISANKMKS